MLLQGGGLREIARNETEKFAAQNRGFGLMPAISLSKAAQTTIEAIEKRMKDAAIR